MAAAGVTFTLSAMSEQELENVDNEDDVGEQHEDDSDEEEDFTGLRTDEMTDDDAAKSGEKDGDSEVEQAEEVSSRRTSSVITYPVLGCVHSMGNS